MDANQIVIISIGGVFLIPSLILIGIFVVFVAFPKLTVRVTANQTRSKRYKDVVIKQYGGIYGGYHKKVDMTKCHYVYQTPKKSYYFKMKFYEKTQRQSPLHVSVTYIKAFPRIFYVRESQGLGLGKEIYLAYGIIFAFIAIIFLVLGFLLK
jgi:hypothetical protein